jgi:3-hydroxymyristoyl/3-hydroxydecanoyl-(acyl carrier protein) dehydratase
MREDGFHLRGRLDRIVKLQEQRISLSDIETRLKASAAIQDVRVVALNRGATGRDALGAVIVPTAAGWGDIRRRGKRNLVEALSTGLRPFVQSSAVPRRWRFVRCLPCDERGKVTIRSLLDLFEVNAGSITQPNVIDTLQREKSLTLTLALPDGLFYFRGHFDEAPLLPGVVQIDWAIRFAEAHFSLIPSPYRIEALKFFNVITTGRELSLTLTYDAAILRLQFEYDVAGQKCSSGRVVLEGSS